MPGTLRAVGTAAVLFVPDQPLPPATRFRVEVPEGVLANDNTTLAETVRFSFETPRPRVLEMLPQRELQGLRSDHPFLFKFDQTVDPRVLASHARFEMGRERVPATVVVDPADPSYLRITPGRPLPQGARVQLVIDAGLTGTQGPLPIGREIRRDFSVHGPPGIEAATCEQLDGCRAPASRC